jgi:hypothetical protein
MKGTTLCCLQKSLANPKCFGVKLLRTDELNKILKRKLKKTLNSWQTISYPRPMKPYHFDIPF